MNPFDEVISYIKENKIVLDRPIAFFDLETTGLNVMTDHIIEIDAVKINPDYTVEDFYSLVNPGVHIPDEASGVNNICDDDVKDKPTFAQISDKLLTFFGTPKSCDIGGYNILKFDIPLLVEEFKRVGKVFLERVADVGHAGDAALRHFRIAVVDGALRDDADGTGVMFGEHESGGKPRQPAAYDQVVEITFFGCLHFFSSKITKEILIFPNMM